MTEDLACKEFVELVTEYLEGELPMALRSRFEQHLAICSDCQEYLHQVRVSMTALRQAWERSLPVEEREAILNLFREWASSSQGIV